MGGSNRAAGCAKFGCVGCGGTALVVALFVGVVLVFAIGLGPPDRELVEPEVSRQVTRTGEGAGTPLDGASSDRGTEPSLTADESGSGRVVLDLHGGNFEVVSADDDETPFRIDGRYDGGSFELKEQMERLDDGSWTYTVRFRRTVSWMRLLQGNRFQENRLRITLPRGVPFELEADIGQGESDLSLGGLSLVSADLRLGKGEHQVRFRDPNPVPMRALTIDGSMGSIEIRDVGNASPATVDTRGGMGEFLLDMRGAWRNDATVTSRWSMGECRLRVPSDVNIASEGTRMMFGEVDLRGLRDAPEAPPGAPTLTLQLRGSMGTVEVSR